MEVTGGTFRDEVEDVLANDNHGQSKEYRTAHVYDVRDGKLARCWEQSTGILATFDAVLRQKQTGPFRQSASRSTAIASCARLTLMSRSAV